MRGLKPGVPESGDRYLIGLFDLRQEDNALSKIRIKNMANERCCRDRSEEVCRGRGLQY
ncbi:hypothetical protein [Reichenbachiella sp. 5M10]|uniref:hypothetical protein n=1 Tax=Reichenbachiella sp. 5M10 TaxID=1889772 RepID=UPI0013041C63|nr:hypothetical protein [Reichenbachiella sp. 5M10]